MRNLLKAKHFSAVQISPMQSIRLVVQACAGVLLGVLLAMLVAGLLFPVGGRPTIADGDILPWAMKTILSKPREKGFYILSLLFGFGGAYLATLRVYTGRIVLLFAGLMLSMPLICYLAVNVLQHNQLLWLLLITFVSFLSLFVYLCRDMTRYHLLVLAVIPAYRVHVKPYIIFLFILMVLLIPHSFTELAVHISSRVEYRIHLVSFMEGPALYFLGNHLLPGIDYFTQYSIGMGWLFSHLLGQTSADSLTNYTKLIVFSLFVFYTQLFSLLYWLYRSWVPAGIVSLISLVLLFHTKAHFFDPSSSILRYPLLGVVAWLMAGWLTHQDSSIRKWILASALALSVFFNTETGIIMTLATCASVILTSKRPHTCFLSLIYLVTLTVLLLTLLLVAVFGTSVLRADFITSLVKPLFIYGKVGFGGWLIAWDLHDFNWFYNLVTPAIGISTLALIAHSANAADADRPRLAVLAFFIAASLLMLFKYINMSINGLWQANSLGLLVALGWWGSMLVFRCRQRQWHLSVAGRSLAGSTVVSVFLGISIFTLIGLPQDRRNPSEYALRSWVLYPSFARSIFHRKHDQPFLNSESHQPSAKDVELIRSRTKEGEQVAMVDLYDWIYLTAAHRPPLMLFLPSVVIFTKHQLQETMLRLPKSPYLFLVKGKDGEPLIENPDMAAIFKSSLNKEYVLESVGDRIMVWRRRDSRGRA